MGRRFGPTLAVLAVLALGGCRSIGRFPTIDPTDYAYSYFNGFYSQVFQFNASQVESSALQALGDLGFTKIEREILDGQVKIKCWTLDHRPCCLWVKPRNTAMTLLTVYVGLIGDEIVSSTIMQRVAMNFGVLPRVVIPMEPSLERRFNPTPPLQPTMPRVVSIPSSLLPDSVPLDEPPGGDVAPTPYVVPDPPPPAPGADPGLFGPSGHPTHPPATTPAPNSAPPEATPATTPGS